MGACSSPETWVFRISGVRFESAQAHSPPKAGSAPFIQRECSHEIFCATTPRNLTRLNSTIRLPDSRAFDREGMGGKERASKLGLDNFGPDITRRSKVGL
jgi:hypothetical protein